jgi:hypothetical protein
VSMELALDLPLLMLLTKILFFLHVFDQKFFVKIETFFSGRVNRTSRVSTKLDFEADEFHVFINEWVSTTLLEWCCLNLNYFLLSQFPSFWN